MPNLQLLEHGPTVKDGQISPGYGFQPAPMGLSDFGLGATGPYAYNTTNFLGTLTLNAPPNATNPGAAEMILPNGGSQGYISSPYVFGVQLNTVLTNITIPGTNDGQFWTQNVLDISDSGIHLVSDTFNATAGSGFYIPPTGTIVSGCLGQNVQDILEEYGGVFQCVGATISITPADYPMTIQLYNNVSVDPATHNDYIAYGYNFVGAGGFHATGIFNNVTFNNPTGAAPTLTPGFEVSGMYASPYLLYDAEMDIVGGIGGDNAVFSSLNGSIALQYTNASGSWHSIPSAYNFGGDTGETSTGVAGYWTGTTERINAGPSFLYGLWNGVPHVSVASGDIQFNGTISPNYGFVFVSNVDPTTNNWGYNFSWVPTNTAGDFNTYLPAGGIPPSTTYYVQSFAAGYGELNSTPFSASQDGYGITLSPSAGPITAPLYMNGNAQAAALEEAIYGVRSTPYTFSGLNIAMNLTFTHFNDYTFPSFVIFSATGVTGGLNVSDDFQAPNSASGATYYTYDYPSTGGLIPGSPQILVAGTQFGQQFWLLQSPNVNVTDQIIGGQGFGSPYAQEGGAIFLWKDTHAYVANIITGSYSTSPGWGVYVGDSVDTNVWNVTNEAPSYGIDDISSTGTTVSWVNATSVAIQAYGAAHAVYSEINVTGVYAAALYAGSVQPFGYYNLVGLIDSVLTNVTVTDATGLGIADSTSVGAGHLYEANGLGAIVEGSNYTSFANVMANGGTGVVFGGAPAGMVTNVVATNGSTGVVLQGSTGGSITTVSASSGAVGVYADGSSGFSVTGVTVPSLFSGATGVYSYQGSGGMISNVNETDGGNGVFLNQSSGFSIIGVSAYDQGSGVTLYQTTGGTVSAVSSSYVAVGLEMYETVGGTVSAVTASYSDGVEVDGGTGQSLTSISATGGLGAGLVDTSGATVSSVTATQDALGVLAASGQYNAISGVTASSESMGIYDANSSWDTVSGVTASGSSIGVGLYETAYTTVSTVTATGTSPAETPWVLEAYYGAPTAAVVSEYTSALTLSGVTATAYPAAWYDIGSTAPKASYLNASGGFFGIVLNDTYNALATNLGAYQDNVGALLEDYAYANTITASSFVDNARYGVMLTDSYVGQTHRYADGNTIFNNQFVGNNGATSVYSQSHIQAYSAEYNDFYICTNAACTTGLGNYWSDWHTYGANGLLAPYLVSGNSIDEFPIGPAETFAVTFTESGLAPGTNWTVAFNGVVTSSASSTVVFTVPMGTYSYNVENVANYTVTPNTGTVTVGAAYDVPVTFSPIPVTPPPPPSPPTLYAITLSEGGLSPATTWSATVNGTTQSTSGTTLTFYLPAGSYSYSFGAVSGYSLGASGTGTVTVTNAPVSVSTSYAPNSTPSLASTSDLNNAFTVALLVAVLALIVALVAIVIGARRNRGGSSGQSAPPTAWTPPAAATTGTSAPPAGGSGEAKVSDAGWNEGSVPSGGSESH